MSVRMRHTKGHTGNRRSHHGLKEVDLSACTNCNTPKRRHRMCTECGFYKGRQVVDMSAHKERTRRRKEEKERAIGEVTGREPEKKDASEHTGEPAEASKPLSAEELSKKQ